MVPANTAAPADFSTGMLSPVSMDSSTADAPSRTLPSTAIRSPGRTTRTSKGRTCSTGISISVPSRSTRATAGCNSMSRWMAAEAFPRARASSIRPSRMSAIITGGGLEIHVAPTAHRLHTE